MTLLTLHLVTDADTFKSLSGEWSELVVKCHRASVFMQWEWHYTWWQVYASRRDRLHIVTFRLGGTLVGLLPLYRQAGFLPGSTCLRLIGTGESKSDEVASEYGDLLCVDSLSQEISARLASHLAGFSAWNTLELHCLLADSLLLEAIRGGDNPHVLIRSAGLRYRLVLDSDADLHLGCLEASRARRIARSQRALQKGGGLRSVHIESAASFDKAFQELAELNHERQTHKQRKSVFASQRFRRFHHALCQRLYPTGSADIIRYYLGSRLLAVLYCFYDDESCHYYQSGFARKDANRFMPLTHAHIMEIQRNRDAGRHYYDFMRGNPSSYKAEYNCETTPMVDVSAYHWRWQRRLASIYRWSRGYAASWLRTSWR